MIKDSQKRNQGFTLIEILVFAAITSILLVLLLSLLMSFLKSRGRATKLGKLEDTGIYIFNDLTQEVHWSDEVEFITHGITLTQIPADETEPPITITYQLNNDRLLKNGQPLSPEEIKVVSFEITDRAQDQIVSCLKINLVLEYLDLDTKIQSEHETTISLRRKQLAAHGE